METSKRPLLDFEELQRGISSCKTADIPGVTPDDKKYHRLLDGNTFGFKTILMTLSLSRLIHQTYRSLRALFQNRMARGVACHGHVWTDDRPHQ